MKGTGAAPFLGFAGGNLIAPSTLNFRIRSVTATYSFHSCKPEAQKTLDQIEA